MTLKKLQKINPSITDYNEPVNERDVEIANNAVRKMYRKPMQVAAGDVVEFTSSYGEFSPRAIIERVDGEAVSICQNGSAWCSNSKKYVSVSGGSFYEIPMTDLVYIGRTKRNFSVWGHHGACARGALEIPMTVNLWRNKSDLKYTTEHYNQHYIYEYSEEFQKQYHCNYSYGEHGKNAWTSNEELSAWCVLNRAFIDKHRQSGDGYNNIVWTYKRREQYWLDDDDVLKMDGFHDFERMNGAIRNVCYAYDDEKKNVTVYFGKDDVSEKSAGRFYSYDWDKRHFENALKIVRENKLHFPESFLRG